MYVAPRINNKDPRLFVQRKNKESQSKKDGTLYIWLVYMKTVRGNKIKYLIRSLPKLYKLKNTIEIYHQENSVHKFSASLTCHNY